jgi:hypothetical protein
MTPAEMCAGWAELVAFGLMASSPRKNPWATHFGPTGTFEDHEGKAFYRPDVTSADPGTLDYWASRAHTVSYPILQARYADLVWEMAPTLGLKRRNAAMARLAVDAYLASVPLRGEMHDRFHAAARALELAALMIDKPRIAAARATLLALHREAMDAKHQWMFAFGTLIDNPRAGLTDAERQSLLDDLEAVVERCSISAPESFSPHDVKDAAQRLIDYFSHQLSCKSFARCDALHE